jgi:hypothetical protein
VHDEQHDNSSGHTSSKGATRASRPLLQRLRPFLRRDLRPRALSAVVAATLLSGLTWLGTSALTRMDSPAAQDVRVALGMEKAWEVCDAPGKPLCSYDDREQAAVDREFMSQQRIRLVILNELSTRVTRALDNLQDAEDILKTQTVDLQGDLLGGRKDLSDLLLTTIDLRPLTSRDEDLQRTSSLQIAASTFDIQGQKVLGNQDALLNEIAAQRRTLQGHAARLDRLTRREGEFPIDTVGTDRQALWADLFNSDPYGAGGELAGWVLSSGGLPTVTQSLAGLAQYNSRDLAEAVFSKDARVWQDALTEPLAEFTAVQKPSVRYRSPVEDSQRWQLLGSLLLGFASFMLLLVGPVITATHTAREREAGTLPVLRMTGLSAGDLALAMTLGPNVFAMLGGGLLLLISTIILGLTAGPAALLLPLALLLVLSAATHLTAIGIGDALGHRVNALLVGALMALGIAGTGVVGGVLVGANMASAGLLLGPLPAVLGGALGLSGLPGTADLVVASDPELGPTILGYAVLTQLMVAGICLLSWRRRVEQAWAPLFRPAEGIALAIASIGCSALTMVDLSARINTQSFDSLNLVTFLASAFLLPLLGWLLVASLRRPARAHAVPSHVEARSAFLRFQGVLALSMLAVGMAYTNVMATSGLSGEQSEVMWATLAQIILIAETAVAGLLLSSRRRAGRLGISMATGALLVVQIAFAVLVYRLEVDHVAVTHTAGMPFLYGMGASPYWIALMILVWGSGFGLILTALLRERDRARTAAAAEAEEPNEDGETGEAGDRRGRWLH